MKTIEIMDTTLRDGEQTQAVSFKGEEKLTIAKTLLEDVNVSRIEVCSAKVSPKEQETLSNIMAWAKENGYQDKVEVLSFVDYNKSVDWLEKTGCRRINLLTKGSKKHCEMQLNKSIEEHIADIKKTVEYAKAKGFVCNVYLEDWSNGVKESKDYVYQLLATYKDLGFERILLPDTLGVLNPFEVFEYVSLMTKDFPDFKFEFHAHNDYGFATANALAAIKAGASGVHTTINALGERTGNADLSQVVVCINDHTDFECAVNENKLKEISVLVETFAGKRIPSNMPILGKDVFTQTAGIHADGDKKGSLYISKLSPERFNRATSYALGKLSGKASLDINLKKMKIELNDDQKKKLLEKVIELGDMKKTITPDDLPFLVFDMLEGQKNKKIRVAGCVIATTMSMKPSANIQIEYQDKVFEESAIGNGGYDAFMQALHKLAPKMNITVPKLVDFEISIPPGGQSNSLVEASIKWDDGKTTHGVSSDQVKAAIKATERMLNLL